MRWAATKELGNDGKGITVWQLGEFEVSQNYFDGKTWLWELIDGRGHLRGRFATRAAAQQAAIDLTLEQNCSSNENVLAGVAS